MTPREREHTGPRPDTIIAADFHRALEASSWPTNAILQAGQINTGAFDPFDQIVPAALAAGAWIHVDGAFGLWRGPWDPVSV
jgi:glutamate/tyrosine decarboxylase-like PLP-dependent enzyme